MPEFLEDTLKAQARKKGLTGRAADRYTYGAMNNMGAIRGNKITAKGEAIEAKHDAAQKAVPLSSMLRKFKRIAK